MHTLTYIYSYTHIHTYIEGEFLNDKRDGHGDGVTRDGSRFIGTWKQGKMHGKGHLFPADGSKVCVCVYMCVCVCACMYVCMYLYTNIYIYIYIYIYMHTHI